MRRRVACVGAALAACCLAGAAWAADPLDPVVKPTKASQIAAKDAVLSRADLGTKWAGNAVANPSSKLPVCPAQHPSYHDLTVSGHAETVFVLQTSGITVDSDAQVLQSPAVVASTFTRMLGPKLSTCLRYNLVKTGVPASAVGAVTKLALPVVGEHSAAYRVTVNEGSILADFIFLGSGRTQMFLNIVAPVSQKAKITALERRLTQLLVTRTA